MDKVLNGVTVLEFAGIGPCPFAAMVLADMGARVITVERVGTSASMGRSWEARKGDPFLRGKEIIEINLKNPLANGVVDELIRRSNVLLEGFRPGVMERLGYGPSYAMSLNPTLVYGRMTGYGQEGVFSSRAGHDINYISISGVLSTIGTKDGAPTVPVNYVGDFGGGAMLLLIGVLGALAYAQRSGEGRVVDASMVEGSSLLATMIHGFRAKGSWQDTRGSNLLDGGAPFYRTYRCKDGGFVSVGALEPQFFAELISTLGLDDDEIFSSQYDRSQWPKMEAKLAEVFSHKDRKEWEEVFFDKDACVTPVLTLDEAQCHPHNLARDSFVSVDGVPQPAPAPRFFDNKLQEQVQDLVGASLRTAEILKELGYSKEQVSELYNSQVVA
ncbi:alpha-methylacyl-CoA racemase [Ferrithrix thermotolerans DSM 19514]|uniref:Alpha-methylacyl-CoA racemase n=1 Tax=Ferrithrix thermotolerans DSM 19514 TaxID=1121881 RepID=A0A1M4S565_9ACTN|nr:CaiB/BaiF CoA-transferase family protein [Ferrithrix thermotolerans]SHE27329.1 alpha-methylacyl-CoA racemase [Ferrithrix thermotolerans DSM 19514]